MMHEIIPLLDYPGRKAAEGQWQKIISEIPKCSTFIDAMCGSGFIASLVTNCSIVLNDYDRSVIEKIVYTGDGVIPLNLHYKKIVEKYDHLPGTVFYFDPPYMMETRSYKGKLYKYEWSNNDHKEFMKVVQAMKSPVMISHYPCGYYDKTLKKWRKISYNSMTRAGVRKENLYMNFPQPVLLQCYKSIGENFTDRQRIKRKVDRLILRLEREAPQERAAILSSIIDKYDYV